MMGGLEVVFFAAMTALCRATCSALRSSKRHSYPP